MKPHITNVKHQKFVNLLEDNINKMEEMPNEQKLRVSEKILQLQSNKEELDGIYSNYLLKLKELSTLLDTYERTQHVSRINLRKMQNLSGMLKNTIKK